nr:F-box protein At3g08750-like [Quercus suber]
MGSSRSSDRQVCTVALDRTFDRISEVQIPIDISLNSVRMVSSCNGLLCFTKHGSRKAIFFCNPSIRKFKTLPVPCLGHLKYVSLGLAYHYENNNYKVVRISSSSWMSTVSQPEIEVYTLSLDSWRSVGIEFATNVVVYDYNFCLTILLVNGALHWLAHIKEGEEKQGIDIIMAFDVNTEKFRKLAALPHVFIKTNPCDRYIIQKETGFHYIWK